MKTRSLFSLLTLLLVSIETAAAITFPAYITDNMIVQRNSTLTLCGQATPNSTITLMAGWATQKIKAKADANGSFSVIVDTPEAGGPYSMTISDNNEEVTINNILSGEVWLCSGQSNMEFPINGWASVMDYDNIIPKAQHPDIRFLQITKQTAYTPQKDCQVNMGGWVECSPATVPEFSAIAYLYALELLNELKVPVGVIDATWGGTPVEAWTSIGGIKTAGEFKDEMAALERVGYDGDKLLDDYNKRLDEWMTHAYSLREKKGASAKTGVMPTGSNWEMTALPAFDGVVTVRRTIEIPAAAAGQPLVLYLGAIDDEDITLFNGVEIARGSGYDIQRVYTVPGEMVKAGKAEIAITITDMGGGGGFNGGDRMRAVAGAVEIPLEGDWDYTVLADFRMLPPKPINVSGPLYPTVLYNAMIHPLANMPIRGVIWYQGCANVGRDKQYEKLFKQLITDWRTTWNNPNMAFNFVQLAGYLKPSYCQPESEWAALRHAQATALSLPHTGMATAIDLGHPDDIHPRNKQDVARRLALIAFARQYGKDVEYAAPELTSIKASAGKLILKFNKAVLPGSSAVTGFIVAGEDGKYVPAYGRLTDKNTIELSSPLIAKPINARYDWADYPGGNLYGETHLPVLPFATDK